MEEMFENFGFMVVEEFLKKKGMSSTLNELRHEWNRPSDEESLVTWYDIALKLRLPELINISAPPMAGTTSSSKTGSSATLSPNTPILESLLFALVRESSLRNRRPVDVTMSGLAASFRHSTAAVDISPTFPDEALHDELYEEAIEEEINEPPLPEAPREDTNIGISYKEKEKVRVSTKNRERDAHNLSLLNQVMLNNKNISNENWIPEDQRMRSIGRNFKVAQECLTDIQKREVVERREMKVLGVTDLAKAKVKESLGSLKKLECGCCQRLFLDVNLPLKVSKKAIMDIRIVWSGSLNSRTVFGGSPEKENKKNKKKSDAEQYDTDGESDTEIASAPPLSMKEQLGHDKKQAILTRLGCYESSSVCIFCAQFFTHQEEYRPSYNTITFQERKAVYFENKRKEQEYWDPLKMMEKDRLIMEKRQIKQMNSEMKEEMHEEDSLNS